MGAQKTVPKQGLQSHSKPDVKPEVKSSFKPAQVHEEEKKEETKVDPNESMFECNICLDIAKEPVVTKCGHLYCWSCLYMWMK